MSSNTPPPAPEGTRANCWYCNAPGHVYRNESGGYNLSMCDKCRDASRPLAPVAGAPPGADLVALVREWQEAATAYENALASGDPDITDYHALETTTRAALFAFPLPTPTEDRHVE